MLTSLQITLLKCIIWSVAVSHIYHALPSLLFQLQTPPKWASIALNTNKNQPPFSTSPTKPHPSPRRHQSRWMVFCASRIPDIPHPKKWKSPFFLNQSSTISLTPQPNAAPFHTSTSITSTIHTKISMTAQHTHTKFYLINTSTPHYHLLRHSTLLPHIHPNPPSGHHQRTYLTPTIAPWQTHTLPHWLKPWQQVRNCWPKKMDGQADGQQNNMLHICLYAHSLICYLVTFKIFLPFP